MIMEFMIYAQLGIVLLQHKSTWLHSIPCIPYKVRCWELQGEYFSGRGFGEEQTQGRG